MDYILLRYSLKMTKSYHHIRSYKSSLPAFQTTAYVDQINYYGQTLQCNAGDLFINVGGNRILVQSTSPSILVDTAVICSL